MGTIEKFCFSGVRGLFKWCCPVAILRFIIAVIVDSVDLVSERWWIAHVRNKIQEVVAPSLANRNAAASIAWEAFHFRIVTAAYHSLPSNVKNVFFSHRKSPLLSCCRLGK